MVGQIRCRTWISLRKDMREEREKVEDTERTPARHGARKREERWGNAVKRARAEVEQRRRM